jgi:hypothetical protein
MGHGGIVSVVGGGAAVAFDFSFAKMPRSQLSRGVVYADASLHGSEHDVHHGDGAQFACGSSHQSRHDRRSSRRQHHGLHSHGQYHALRHVHVAGKSDGGCRNRGRYGRSDPYALHSRHGRALGSWGSDGTAGRDAHARQYLDEHVHVGGRHQLRHAGRDDRDGAIA